MSIDGIDVWLAPPKAYAAAAEWPSGFVRRCGRLPLAIKGGLSAIALPSCVGCLTRVEIISLWLVNGCLSFVLSPKYHSTNEGFTSH